MSGRRMYPQPAPGQYGELTGTTDKIFSVLKHSYLHEIS